MPLDSLEIPVAARISVDAVKVIKELYPRLKEDDAAIERYRTALDKLPPIVIAKGGILVDGFHRLQAHKREGAVDVPFIDLGDLSDAEIVRESIARNAAHGQQLSAKDKQNLAGKLWLQFGHLPAGERTAEIAELLSVDDRTVQRWTKDARTAEKESQQDAAWDRWLNCEDQASIADAVGVAQQTISGWLTEKRQLSEFGKPPESRQHFDVWSFHKADNESSSYFGRMPPQVVENLLWFYTEPGDIVFDPFAGGGTTIDVAKAMGRRIWSSDRKPSSPLKPIKQHDITTGWPEAAPKKAALIILDPPYWQQAKGKYSEDAEDLGNMSLDDFNSSWGAIVETCAAHLDDDGKLAFIISPTQTEDGTVIDHAMEMAFICMHVGLRIERRIIVPYQTQQATGQQVEWAREKRRMLKLYRDLVVMAK